MLMRKVERDCRPLGRHVINLGGLCKKETQSCTTCHVFRTTGPLFGLRFGASSGSRWRSENRGVVAQLLADLASGRVRARPEELQRERRQRGQLQANPFDTGWLERILSRGYMEELNRPRRRLKRGRASILRTAQPVERGAPPFRRRWEPVMYISGGRGSRTRPSRKLSRRAKRTGHRRHRCSRGQERSGH